MTIDVPAAVLKPIFDEDGPKVYARPEITPEQEALMGALLDVLAWDAMTDEQPAFFFRPGWWTWEHPGSGPSVFAQMTLREARRRLS